MNEITRMVVNSQITKERDEHIFAGFHLRPVRFLCKLLHAVRYSEPYTQSTRHHWSSRDAGDPCGDHPKQHRQKPRLVVALGGAL
jgi:hypothetical protein